MNMPRTYSINQLDNTIAIISSDGLEDIYLQPDLLVIRNNAEFNNIHLTLGGNSVFNKPYTAISTIDGVAPTDKADAISKLITLFSTTAKFVSLGSETITITGNVNVGTSVEVNNTTVNPVPVIERPQTITATIISALTAAVGSNYTAFGSVACTSLEISNNTGTTIEYRRGATGTAFPIPTGTVKKIVGITNANQIDIRRTDTSNTQVTVYAETFAI